MTSRTMIPLLGILDDTDAPEARMLVVLHGRIEAPRCEYVSQHVRPIRRGPGPRMRPPLFTPLSEFGVEVRFQPDGRLRARQAAPSRATYPDGKPRPWQDRRGGLVAIRPELERSVLRAAMAMTPGAPEARPARRPRRLSPQTMKVIRILYGEPDLSGADLTRRARLVPGTVYPLLARLEAAGWVSGTWEDTTPRKAGRPIRRLYSMTPKGRSDAEAGGLVENASEEGLVRPPAPCDGARPALP